MRNTVVCPVGRVDEMGAAALIRCHTEATLAKLAKRFGLSHPDSSSDLVERAKRHAAPSPEIQERIDRVQMQLGRNPETRACPLRSACSEQYWLWSLAAGQYLFNLSVPGVCQTAPNRAKATDQVRFLARTLISSAGGRLRSRT